MLLERTIRQLAIGPVPPDRAKDLGKLGFRQWLAGLPGAADYRAEAMSAYIAAAPFVRTSPAVAAFCALLVDSARMPPRPLDLALSRPGRRGGARARRMTP
jgi:hypothetical protein